MPRDLFAEAGIYPNAPDQRAPRDLFAEAGIDPKAEMPNQSMLDKLANNPAVDAINDIGYETGELIGTPFAALHNLVMPTVNKALGTNIPQADANFSKYAPQPEIAQLSGLPLSVMFAPELIGSKVAGALPSITKNAPSLVKAFESLAKGATGAASEGAAWTGMFNAANPNADLSENVGKNAGLSAALSTLLRGSAGAVNSLTKLGKRSPEEIQQISQRIGDAPINIGEVIDSEPLKKISSIVDAIPFSGGKASKARQVNSLEDEASGFVERLLGNTEKGNSEQALLDQLRGNRGFHKEISRANYKNISDIAESKAMSPDAFGLQTKGVKIKPSNLLSAIDDVKRNYTNIEMPGLPIFKDLSNGKISQYGYKETNGYQSNLRKAANSAIVQGDNQKAAAYTKLREALLDDMQTHLGKSNMPELVDQFKAARNYHRDNVAPYEKSENATLYKAIIGNRPPENIAKELIKPENTKIVEHMTPEQRNLLAYNLLKKRIDTDAGGSDFISPAYLMNDINSIPKRYKDLIFGDKVDELNKLETLTKLTKDLRNAPSKSQTGRSLKENIQDATKIGGAYGLAKLGWLPAVSTLGGSSLLANALRRQMENPKTRQAFINQQIVDPNKANNLTNAFIRMLAQQNSGGNQ